MKVILALILVSGVYSRTLRLSSPPQQIVLDRDVSDKTNQDYFTISDQKHENPLSPDVLAQLRQYYLNKVEVDEEERTLRPAPMDSEEIARSAYFFINTIKQRNKRYTSYLTLCHFKICNMGRKRTARYFHMIKSLHDQS